MTKKEVADLLNKYNAGTCTEEEKQLLEKLYDKVLTKQSIELRGIDLFSIKSSVYQKLPRSRTQLVRRYLAYAAAAIILLCFSVTMFAYLSKEKPTLSETTAKVHDITPGGNVAILTLSNGKKIVLDDTTQTVLAKQAGVKIVKSNGGQLLYVVDRNNVSDGPVGFNIAETPKGGQYQIHLADGTVVWLNASSSLRFPVRFAGHERMVELTGEAYFDVSHDASKPFIVKTADQHVQVLGTQFNLNSYPDEPSAITTLLEGSIKVKSNHSGKASVLKPGEQSLLSASQFTVQTADVEEAVAWKNGYFRFQDEKIESIMRKLGRWYNMDHVKYVGSPSQELFTGKISRFRNISQVLNMLEKKQMVCTLK